MKDENNVEKVTGDVSPDSIHDYYHDYYTVYEVRLHSPAGEYHTTHQPELRRALWMSPPGIWI